MSYIRTYLNNVLIDQIELKKDQLSIGRSSDCDIVLDNAGVSSHHATVVKDGGLFIIVDNKSRNGVFVNGNKIARHTLEYRDEIQIYNYVLKFMALPALQDQADPDIAQDAQPSQAGTMEVDMSSVQDLLKLRESKKRAYVTLGDTANNAPRYPIKADRFRIGRSKDCDLRAPGWLPFGVFAEIERRADGYYLVPFGKRRVTRNGIALADATKLMDGDALKVGRLAISFFHRVTDEQ